MRRPFFFEPGATMNSPPWADHYFGEGTDDKKLKMPTLSVGILGNCSICCRDGQSLADLAPWLTPPMER
jgi:hypothetical protein